MVTEQRSRTEAVFRALADPTRRAILDLLRGRELSAGQIALRFPISRPAVSRHLRILREAGLVREARSAQSRRYVLTPASLAPLDRWLGGYRMQWSARPHDFRRPVEERGRGR